MHTHNNNNNNIKNNYARTAVVQLSLLCSSSSTDYAIGTIAVGIHFAASVSYQDVVVIQLEAIEEPGSGSEESGHRQREGQTLHVATLHDGHLNVEDQTKIVSATRIATRGTALTKGSSQKT